MSDNPDEEIKQCVSEELRALATRSEKHRKELEECLEKKKELEKSKDKDSKKELVDLQKAAKQAAEKIVKETDTTNDRIRRMLEQKLPEGDEGGDTAQLEKKLGKIVTKDGLKIGKDMYLKPDINLKKKDFKLEFTWKF